MSFHERSLEKSIGRQAVTEWRERAARATTFQAQTTNVLNLVRDSTNLR